MLNNLLYILTTDSELILRAESLIEGGKEYVTKLKFQDRILCIYSKKKLGKLNIISIINDLGEISLSDETAFLSEKYDSISTRLVLSKNYSIFKADHFGIQPVYYSSDAGTIMVSNNLFLINKLKESSISKYGMFDSLLFKKPRKDRTWFNNISVLLPNEELKIYHQDGKVARSNASYPYDLLETKSGDYVDEFSSFYEQAFSVINQANLDVSVSLSAGSDSRTVLAGVLSQTSKLNTYSWGGMNYTETKLIKDLVGKLNLKWHLVNFKKLRQEEENYIQKSQLSSNGLAPSTHYYYYYSNLSNGIALFEGYGGSEFFKAELSDGMYTQSYHRLITEAMNKKDILREEFSFLSEPVLNEFVDYIMTEYQDSFENLNSRKGYKKFAQYVLDFIPSRVFSGVFTSGLFLDINMYEPFFSKKILGALYANNLGVKHSTSISANFPGKFSSIKPQSDIVKKMYPKLLSPRLDRGISLKEAYYPKDVVKVMDKFRILKKVISNKKNEFSGQVDFKNVYNFDLTGNINKDMQPLVQRDSAQTNHNFQYVNSALNSLALLKDIDYEQIFNG